MEQDHDLIPEQFRRMIILTLTLVAVALYAAIIVSAIVVTLTRENPQFSDNMERAAGLLSGLVGAVVTAGFARSKPSGAVPVSISYPVAGDAVTGWWRWRSPSLATRNLEGLGDLLGLPDVPPPAAPEAEPLAPDEDTEAPEAPLLPAQGMSAKTWIALAYVLVYITVGLAAFVVVLWRSPVPSIVANAAWVWFGTLISSTYSFFGLE
jgi:flagellar basal body-associated protein FliL